MMFSGDVQNQKEASQAFADAQKLCKTIIDNPLAATMAEVDHALALLKKGQSAPEAGSAPTGKHYILSKQINRIADNMRKRQRRASPNPNVT